MPSVNSQSECNGTIEAATVNTRQRTGSIEFLEFLADISNPATGEISADRLAHWLCQTAAELKSRWHDRGSNLPWALFADEMLAVLDAAQDETCDLETTVGWYLKAPIALFDKKTPEQVVIAGGSRRLVEAMKAKEVLVSDAGVGRNL